MLYLYAETYTSRTHLQRYRQPFCWAQLVHVILILGDITVPQSPDPRQFQVDRMRVPKGGNPNHPHNTNHAYLNTDPRVSVRWTSSNQRHHLRIWHSQCQEVCSCFSSLLPRLDHWRNHATPTPPRGTSIILGRRTSLWTCNDYTRTGSGAECAIHPHAVSRPARVWSFNNTAAVRGYLNPWFKHDRSSSSTCSNTGASLSIRIWTSTVWKQPTFVLHRHRIIWSGLVHLP